MQCAVATWLASAAPDMLRVRFTGAMPAHVCKGIETTAQISVACAFDHKAIPNRTRARTYATEECF